MYLEKLHTETIDLEGRDVEDVLGSIVLEWARRSGLGSGYYPLIGLLELDPETGLKLDLCAPSYAADSCTGPALLKEAPGTILREQRMAAGITVEMRTRRKRLPKTAAALSSAICSRIWIP